MLTQLLTDDSGQTMVEYGILIALVSVAAIVVLVLLSQSIRGVFQTVDDNLAAVPVTT